MSFRFTIVATTLDDKVFGNISNVSIANAFRNIGKHFEGVAVGAITEAVTLNSGPTYATATVTIASGNMSDADTITVNGVVLTAKTTPTTAVQFKVGSTALQTGINFANCVNANKATTLVTAVYAKSSTSAVITLTALASGTGPNAYTLTQSGSNVTLSGSTFSGGQNGPVAATATITSTGSATNGETALVCNQTLTAKTSGAVAANGEFNISGTVGTQAANIAAAINAVAALQKTVSATASLGVVTITALVPGTIGNGLQISEGLTNVTATAFSGGKDANVVTLHKGI